MNTVRSASRVLAVVLASTAWGQVTQRVSLSSAGAQGNFGAMHGTTSPDGRFVVFISYSNNLVPGDSNGKWDVFVRDRRQGTTDCVSVDSNGRTGNDDSDGGSLSADGRFVTFTSSASNLVPGDTNGTYDAFLRDRITGTTERLSVNVQGDQGNHAMGAGPITPDGRYVLLAGLATNLVPIGTNGAPQLFVRDRTSGTIEPGSVDSHGNFGNYESYWPSISDDGRFVAFVSAATSLVTPDASGQDPDVFVHDRQTGVTERVSVDSNGTQANGSWGNNGAQISGNGRYVAFMHDATNLAPGDVNDRPDVFVHDRRTGTTELASLSSDGVQDNADSLGASISADGRYVCFMSASSDLVPGDTNGAWDVFLRDRLTSSTERMNLDSAGVQVNGAWDGRISGNGRYVSFSSGSTRLVPHDTNDREDIFVRDRFGGTSFTSLCDPGIGGVIACPCANPPSGPGRGCDNSAGTGGANLSASGGTFLSSDSLVFTTTGERPTALSLVLQGNAPITAGAVFGQGVRCAGGGLKRLYTKSASGGSVTAPSFEAGDATVSTRSATLGDPIQLGQSRWYLVCYRDSIVLGGCPATSTFNATQTGEVSWLP